MKQAYSFYIYKTFSHIFAAFVNQEIRPCGGFTLDA